MPKRYSVLELETTGIQAVGMFHGQRREGWIMNEVDFVDYSGGFAQLVMPVADGTDVERWQWYDPEEHHSAEARALTEKAKA